MKFRRNFWKILLIINSESDAKFGNSSFFKLKPVFGKLKTGIWRIKESGEKKEKDDKWVEQKTYEAPNNVGHWVSEDERRNSVQSSKASSHEQWHIETQR